MANKCYLSQPTTIMYLEQEKVCEDFNTFTWRKKNVDEDQDIALNLAWI